MNNDLKSSTIQAYLNRVASGEQPSPEDFLREQGLARDSELEAELKQALAENTGNVDFTVDFEHETTTDPTNDPASPEDTQRTQDFLVDTGVLDDTQATTGEVSADETNNFSKCADADATGDFSVSPPAADDATGDFELSDDLQATGDIAATGESDATGDFGATGDFDLDQTIDHAESSANRSPTQVSVPGYEIEGLLGRGGMGVVLKARQIAADRLVALKLMLNLDRADQEAIERFRVEAQASAQLQHPNIVQLYEVGESDGAPYFTLEYVTGGTLSDKIREQLLTPQEAAECITTLARAIEYAHGKGIIHRDLKPANVLMDEAGNFKIADFGLARRSEADSQLTRDGSILGTPSYMAPEQASGSKHATGPLSDVYSLGTILYELLTGRPPFKGSSVWEVINLVRDEPPTPPSELQTGVPKDLETICLKCLEKTPDRRYESADALADDLQRYLNDEPILARPSTRLERLVRLCRRHPGEAKLVGVAALLLLGLAGVSTGAAIHSSNQATAIAQQNQEITKQSQQLEQEMATSEQRLELFKNSTSRFVNDAQQMIEGLPFATGVQNELAVLTKQLMDVEVDTAESNASRRWAIEAAEIRQGQSKLDQALFLFADPARRAEAIELIKESKQHFVTAKTIAEQVAAEADDPANNIDRAQALANLAAAASRMGIFRRRIGQVGIGKPEQITALYDEAMSLRRQAAELPDGEKPQARRVSECGRELVNYAEYLLDIGRFESAEEHVQEALELITSAIESLPDGEHFTTNAHRDLALAKVVSAKLAAKTGADKREVQHRYELAAESLRTMMKREPDRVSHRRTLSGCLTSFGDFLLFKASDSSGAKQVYVEAMELSLSAWEDPMLSELRSLELAMGFYRLGFAALEQARVTSGEDRQAASAQAQEYFERCALLRAFELETAEMSQSTEPNPDSLIVYRVDLLLPLARAGKTQAALEQIRILINRAEDADSPYVGGNAFLYKFAATGLGLISEHAETPEQKNQWLSQGIKGMHKAIDSGFRDVAYLTQDPDAEPLRTADGFEDLLKRIRELETTVQ